MADPAVDEAYEEYQKKQDNPKKQIQKSFSRKQIITFAVVAGIGFYFVFVKKIISQKEGLFLLGGVGLIIWFLMDKDQNISKVIPMKEAMAIAKKELDYMQKVTYQIPQGTAKIAPIAKLKFIEGKPTKWRVGAEVESIRYRHTQYLIEIEPYEGYVMSCFELPEGFGEIDKPDLKFIPSKELLWKRKYDLDTEDFGLER